MTVGQNIRKIRMKKGLTQEELSAKMGYKSSAILSKLEKYEFIIEENNVIISCRKEGE